MRRALVRKILGTAAVALTGVAALPLAARAQGVCATPIVEPKFAIVANGDGGMVVCDDAGLTSPPQAAPEPPRTCLEDGYYYREGRGNLIIVEDGHLERHLDPKLMVTRRQGLNSSHGDWMILFDGYQSALNLEDTDRQELMLSAGGGTDERTVLQLGEWRYLRFFLNVHPGFGIDTRTNPPKMAGPHRDVIITQVWQRSSVSNTLRESYGPAFEIVLRAKDTSYATLSFKTRNDCNYKYKGACPAYATPGEAFSETIDVRRGQWVAFLIAMKPVSVPVSLKDPQERGSIMLWELPLSTALSYGPNLEGNAIAPNISKRMYWGYRPEEALATPQPGLTDRFDIRVGIYRNEYKPDGLLRLFNNTLYMDSIKLTNDLSVMPGTSAYP